MKSLIESIFNDNIKKDILFGDVVELEDWECADMTSYDSIEMCFINTFLDRSKIMHIIKSPKWKKFLSPFENQYYDEINKAAGSRAYLEIWLCEVFTWIVMCCATKNAIVKKLNEFIKDITLPHYMDNPCSIIKTDIFVIENPREKIPRLVVFKFKSNDNKEIVTYMKLKKRD